MRQEADSAAAASQSETAALISRIRREADAQVAAAREDTAASQVQCEHAWLQETTADTFALQFERKYVTRQYLQPHFEAPSMMRTVLQCALCSWAGLTIAKARLPACTQIGSLREK